MGLHSSWSKMEAGTRKGRPGPRPVTTWVSKVVTACRILELCGCRATSSPLRSLTRAGAQEHWLDVYQEPGIWHAIPSPDPAKKGYDPHARKRKLRHRPGSLGQEAFSELPDSPALLLLILCLQKLSLHQWVNMPISHVTTWMGSGESRKPETFLSKAA